MNIFFKKFEKNENMIILGPLDHTKRVSIISFNIKHKDRILHYNFVV